MRIGDFCPLATPSEDSTGETYYKELPSVESVELGQVLHVERKLTEASEPGNGACLLGVDTKCLDASQLQELDTLVNDFRDTFSTGKHDLGRKD